MYNKLVNLSSSEYEAQLEVGGLSEVEQKG